MRTVEIGLLRTCPKDYMAGLPAATALRPVDQPDLSSMEAVVLQCYQRGTRACAIRRGRYDGVGRWICSERIVIRCSSAESGRSQGTW